MRRRFRYQASKVLATKESDFVMAWLLHGLSEKFKSYCKDREFLV